MFRVASRAVMETVYRPEFRPLLRLRVFLGMLSTSRTTYRLELRYPHYNPSPIRKNRSLQQVDTHFSLRRKSQTKMPNSDPVLAIGYTIRR